MHISNVKFYPNEKCHHSYSVYIVVSELFFAPFYDVIIAL